MMCTTLWYDWTCFGTLVIAKLWSSMVFLNCIKNYLQPVVPEDLLSFDILRKQTLFFFPVWISTPLSVYPRFPWGTQAIWCLKYKLQMVTSQCTLIIGYGVVILLGIVATWVVRIQSEYLHSGWVSYCIWDLVDWCKSMCCRDEILLLNSNAFVPYVQCLFS